MAGPRKILIVDDEVLMVRTLSDILRMRVEVHGAHAGEEALEFLKNNTVDIVLMDVRMGGMTGVDALRVIRQDHPRLPVMLMTAYSTTDLLAEAERQGAVRILSKPLAIGGLMNMLETITDPPRRVLVVDDNLAYLATLADILQSHGYSTLKAESLPKALSLLEARSPEVVLLDMRLDWIEPETSVVAIRNVDPSVVLILYSGSEQALRRTENSEIGAGVYATLRKPFSPESLLEILERAFND